jgi:hypothetical protein
MDVTGEEVLEWAERQRWVITPWQAELIRNADWSKPFEPFPLRPEPREPVQTRRVQRRRHTRAERIRARKVPQVGYVIIVDELAREP